MRNKLLIFSILFIILISGSFKVAATQILDIFQDRETSFISILNKTIHPALNLEKLDSISKLNFPPSRNSFTRYFPEQVVINRIGNIPLQYSYVYSAKGERLITLIQQKQGNTLTNVATESCTYNPNSKITQRTWRTWNGVNWVNQSNETFVYDISNNLTQYVSQNWNNNAWVNNKRTTMSYGAGSVLLSYLEENWTDNNWVNSVYEFYSYFESNLVSGIRQTWAINNWQNQIKNDYTYTTFGGILNVSQSNWVNNAWMNAYRETYTYGTNNLPSSYISEIFDNNSWSNSEKYIYQHDSLGFVETATRQTWISGLWINQNKHWYSRNNFGGIQLLLKESWSVNGWQNESMHQYGYDENGNSLLINVFQWNGSSWGQTSDDILELFYSYSLQKNLYTGSRAEASYISLIVGLDESSAVEPDNPYSITYNRDFNHLEVFNNSLREENSVIYILAANGKTILQQSSHIGQGSTIINIGNLSLKPGLYIAVIKNSVGQSQRKFVKL